MPFLTNKTFVFFFNWDILVKKLVDSYLENSWKHVVNSITDVFLRSPPPPPRLSKEQKLARGVIVVNKAKQRKIRKASSSSSSKSTLDDSGQNKFSFKKYIYFFVFFARNLMNWKEYFPNLLESRLGMYCTNFYSLS